MSSSNSTQTFEQFLAESMPGCDDAQRLIARKAWNAALQILNRERLDKIVTSYVESPMLVDELTQVVAKATAWPTERALQHELRTSCNPTQRHWLRRDEAHLG